MTLTDEISLEPTARDVSRLNTWLDAKSQAQGLAPDLAADMKLCLNEIMANLINYAFQQTPRPEIVIRLTIAPDRVAADIIDNGTAFDLRAWVEPHRESLMHGKLGGFGIALIKERASRIDYVEQNGWNRLTIICERSKR